MKKREKEFLEKWRIETFPTDTEQVIDQDRIEVKTGEEKNEIKQMLKKFWTHVAKAHEESSCMVVMLARLSTALEPDDYVKVVQAGT